MLPWKEQYSLSVSTDKRPKGRAIEQPVPGAERREMVCAFESASVHATQVICRRLATIEIVT